MRSVTVTNQSDKDLQLPKILSLHHEACLCHFVMNGNLVGEHENDATGSIKDQTSPFLGGATLTFPKQQVRGRRGFLRNKNNERRRLLPDNSSKLEIAPSIIVESMKV